MDLPLRTVAIGVLATSLMDLWGFVRQPLFGFPRADYRLIGRWFAYMPRGTFRHHAITLTPPVPGEHVIGWTAHYLIGISFAALLVLTRGPAWLAHPTLAPALFVGLATLVAPLLVMQPAMGAGFASARAANPMAARVQSLISHLVYGGGLYLGGWLLHLILPS
jgi:hypothetical protein